MWMPATIWAISQWGFDQESFLWREVPWESAVWRPYGRGQIQAGYFQLHRHRQLSTPLPRAGVPLGSGSLLEWWILGHGHGRSIREQLWEKTIILMSSLCTEFVIPGIPHFDNPNCRFLGKARTDSRISLCGFGFHGLHRWDLYPWMQQLCQPCHYGGGLWSRLLEVFELLGWLVGRWRHIQGGSVRLDGFPAAWWNSWHVFSRNMWHEKVTAMDLYQPLAITIVTGYDYTYNYSNWS